MGMFDRKPTIVPALQQSPSPQQEEDDDYAGIGEAALKNGGTRYPQLFSDGACSQIVVIDRIKSFKTRKGGITTYLVELRVVLTNNPRVQPGSPRTIMEMASKEGWDGRISRFIMAAVGCQPADVDTAGTRDTFSDAQPFTGLMFISDGNAATDGKGKAKLDASGAPFINCNYRSLNQSEYARAAEAMRAIDPSWKPNALQPGAV